MSRFAGLNAALGALIGLANCGPLSAGQPQGTAERTLGPLETRPASLQVDLVPRNEELSPRVPAEGVPPTEATAGVSPPPGQRFALEQFDRPFAAQLRNNFVADPDFEGGIVVVGRSAAMKIGGYVKADLIFDADAIDSTDSFDTTSILVGGADRQNARFHARQSRLSFDTRWKIGRRVARAFVEADFFGEGTGGSDALRLRHAYGEYGPFTVGQTWTTFTDPSAVPQTLDFEGAVSNVNRRQGLVRLSLPLWGDWLRGAVALENPRINLVLPEGISGEGRTETPDLIGRLRIERDWGDFQVAYLVRQLGFQPTGREVITGTAQGFNVTGAFLLTGRSRAYYQITFGDGIGSYRGSPDVVPIGINSAEVLPVFGWMIGAKQQWTDRLTSNFTFSQLSLDELEGQASDDLAGTTYLAVNLIHNPYDRVFWGVEYLHGIRENISGAEGSADRIQMSFGFYLP